VTLSGFLITHGSALILPLSVIEGPVVSIVTGFLAAQGYFHWYWALPLLVCGDLIGDVIYYAIGRTGIRPLAFLRRCTRLRHTVTPEFQRRLADNAARMLFVGKWTHAIGAIVLIGSGMLRLPLFRFMLINLAATLPKSAVLLGLGYFAGDHFPWFEHHILVAAAAACTAGVASIALVLRRPDGIWAGR
jgi:membrane-associated protein